MKLRQIISAVLITALSTAGAVSAVFGEEGSNDTLTETTLTTTENGGLINFSYGNSDVDLLNVNNGIAMIDDDLPSSYNTELDNLKYITAPKSQSPLETCWAFSATSCMETLLMKLDKSSDASDSKYDFSELHPILAISDKFLKDDTYGYQKDYNAGGNGHMYAMYATRAAGDNTFTGPAAEEELPYDTEISSVSSTDMDIESVGYFPGMFSALDFTNTELSDTEKASRNEIIKKMVYSYGSVSISVYCGSTAGSNYANFKEANGYTLFYESDQTNSANHAVTVVGYDDSFPASNFSDAGLDEPSMNGAFIVKNSWGESWGLNGGYFYMSYASYLDSIYAYGDLVSRDTYDYEYDYTPYLAVGSLKYGPNSQNYYYGCYANYFEKQSEGTEQINKISVYTNSPNCELNLYVDTDASDGKFNNLQAVQVKALGSGSASYTVSSDGYTVTVPYSGNYVFELSEPVEVDSGFTVGVYGKTTSDKGVVAFERSYSNGSVTVAHEYSGNSYLSYSASGNFSQYSDGNGYVDFMIRAYTEEVPVNVTVDGKTYEADYGTVLSDVLSANNISETVYEAVSEKTYKPADTTAAVTDDITLYTKTNISAPTIELKKYQKYPESGTATAIRFVGELTDSFYENVDEVTDLGFVYSADGGSTTTTENCSDLYSSLVDYDEQDGVYLFKSKELDPGSYTVSAYVSYNLTSSEDVITVYTAEKTITVS